MGATQIQQQLQPPGLSLQHNLGFPPSQQLQVVAPLQPQQHMLLPPPQHPQSQPPMQQPPPPAGAPYSFALAGREPSMPAAAQGLSRQASIYSLTLDEFQNAISEPGQKQNFGSMNMDEFLKNIWTAEESQAMAAALAGGADQQQVGLVRQASLQRQSSITLPRTLSRKTVDEVWRDIHLAAPGDEAAAKPGGGGQPRQMTFGEMTLEDFLVKAGVMREDLNSSAVAGAAVAGLDMAGAGNSFGLSQFQTSPFQGAAAVQSNQHGQAGGGVGGGAPPPAAPGTQATLEAIQNAANQQQAEWMNFQLSNAQQQQQQQQAAQQQMLQQQAAEAAAAFVSAHKRAAVGGAGPPPVPAPPPLSLGGILERPAMDVVALPSPGPAGVNGMALVSPAGAAGAARGKKRGAEVVEKVVERRQRRMIKNRESAARSRARKQAYTVELEAEVMQLKDENNRLRKELLAVKDGDDPEENRRRKLSLLDTLAPPADREQNGTGPRRGLRRTRSGQW